MNQNDVVRACQHAYADSYKNGTFIWAYHKFDYANGVDRAYVINTSLKIFELLKKEKDDVHYVACPNCKVNLKVTVL